MCNPHPTIPQLILFDIGGVILSSPLSSIHSFERQLGLPKNYLNVLISSHGQSGAFQRLERGEIDIWTFYEVFEAEMNDTQRGNAAYGVYCERTKRAVPQGLPDPSKGLGIDGRELFGYMMRTATQPQHLIVEAVRRLKKSGKFRVAALTNNFAPPTRVDQDFFKRRYGANAKVPSLEEELVHLGMGPGTRDLMADLFGQATQVPPTASTSSSSLTATATTPTKNWKASTGYYQSHLLRCRKPERIIFEKVLAEEDRLWNQSRASSPTTTSDPTSTSASALNEDADVEASTKSPSPNTPSSVAASFPANRILFLDDIGPNLATARSMGINTIKVGLDRTGIFRAVEDLERWTGVECMSGETRRQEKEWIRGEQEEQTKGKSKL